MLWVIPAAMAAAGAIKGQQDREQEGRDRIAEAEVARWSPWTGLAPGRVKAGPGVVGGAMQGGLAGAGLMQGVDAAGYGKQSPAPAASLYDTMPASGLSQPTAVASVEPMQADPYSKYGNLNLWNGVSKPRGY